MSIKNRTRLGQSLFSLVRRARRERNPRAKNCCVRLSASRPQDLARQLFPVFDTRCVEIRVSLPSNFFKEPLLSGKPFLGFQGEGKKHLRNFRDLYIRGDCLYFNAVV